MGAPERKSAVAQPPLTAEHMSAIKAWAAGEATAEQQIGAFDYVLNVLAQANLLSFRTDAQGGARETDFAEGRRFVGLHLWRIVRRPADELMDEATRGD